MGDLVRLGSITCPSGCLVIVDGGVLGLWSGDELPTETYPAEPDPQGISHRQRAILTARQRLEGFVFSGMPGVAVGGLPTDRPIDVMAEPEPGEDGWRQIVVAVTGSSVASSRNAGTIGVDMARLTFADVDALSHWQHEESLDGLADVLFWGREETDAAYHFTAPRVEIPGDSGSYGWANLPIDEAISRALAIQAWKDAVPGRGLAIDYRPHSHHWQVMQQVRASETESGTVTVAGASILFAMTTWGDGYFPAYADYDASGDLAAIRVVLTGEE
jgi:hypothetical protein